MMRACLAALSCLCAAVAARAEPSLASLGMICWNRDALPDGDFKIQRRQLGEQCLTFAEGSAVISYDYLVGAKEGFSDDGTYSATGDRLTIEHEGDSEAWYGRKGPLPLSLTCRYSITGENRLVLENCPLSGEWSR